MRSMDSAKEFLKHVDRMRWLVSFVFTISTSLFVFVILWTTGVFGRVKISSSVATVDVSSEDNNDIYWHAPDISLARHDQKSKSIEYGKELIAHTSRYLGPEGSLKHISNGLNCQNCHLDAGTKTFGNNYGAVAATYPKFRARSGHAESIEKRVNDCFERSLNGDPLDTASAEMDAIVSYMKFLGTGVDPDNLPEGIGMKKIELLDRAANPANGKQLYEAQCSACHSKNGEGVKQRGASEYQFPPLWGNNSYNNGAGLYRLSNFAQFIYSNMPLGATFDNPILSEQQAWDIAAYVNSLPRPEKNLSGDWPKIESKPFDHPFGPFADPYPEAQHKFGPFKEIQTFNSTKK
jgi:thiosulfate dehydrogenase